MKKFNIKQIFNKENANKVKTGVVEGVKKVIPQKADAPEKWFFKLLALSLLVVMLLQITAGIAGFMLTLKEPEDVVVPAVQGKELADAIDDIQRAGLVPFVHRRFYSNPESRGRIMEQDPKDGTGVKAGRKVNIYLSQGAALDKVGDYSGKNLESVREDIRSAFGSQNPLVYIGTVTYTFDDSEPGTILSQDPLAGTQLSKPVQLGLLVSKGRDEELPQSPDLTGLPWLEAMEKLEVNGLPFAWYLVDGHSDNQSASVVEQSPLPEASIEKGKKLLLGLSAPLRTPDGMKFGIYQKQLPEYAVPIDVSVQLRQEGNAAETLYRFKSIGGEISFPYMVNEGSELVIFVFDKELDRRTIPVSGS